MARHKHDEITQEFWRRVKERNGIAPSCVPPPRIPVDYDDDDRPPLMLGVMIPLVGLVMGAGVVYALYALASLIGG